MFKMLVLLFLFSCSSPTAKKDDTIINQVVNVLESQDSSMANISEKSDVKSKVNQQETVIKEDHSKQVVSTIESNVQEPAAAENSESENIDDTPTQVKEPEKSASEVTVDQAVQNVDPRIKLIKSDLHEDWDYLLKNYVSKGKVNYKGLKSEHRKLKSYIKLLSGTNPNLKTWTRGQRLAYWINVYNAVTVDLILDNYPLKTITELDGGNTWKIKRFQRGGLKYSLDQIENEIIRPKFKDARIHFAVNCGATSCPPLLNEAFKASKLDAQLDRQTRAFINDSRFNVIGTVELRASKIFEWYAEDFGNLLSFFRKYANKPVNAKANVVFLEYDWSLNE